MICSFGDRETEKIANRGTSRKFQAIQYRAERRLAELDAASSLQDLSIPGMRLEKLTGDRKGQYSIRVNDQFRICFEWRDGSAWEVTITDYH